MPSFSKICSCITCKKCTKSFFHNKKKRVNVTSSKGKGDIRSENSDFDSAAVYIKVEECCELDFATLFMDEDEEDEHQSKIAYLTALLNINIFYTCTTARF